MKALEKLLHITVENKGKIMFPKTLYRQTWKFKSIEAAYFTVQPDNYDWNDYVDLYSKELGNAPHIRLVYDKNGDVIGVIVFKKHSGESVKTKGFHKFRRLYRYLKHKK